MVAQAIVTTRPDMEVLMWKATVLFESGLLPQHIKNKNQVIAIDMMAQELNIPTWQAINGINVIQGKPTVSPQLMLALIERSGKLEDIQITASKDGATVTMKRRGRSAHTEAFTIQDAQAMQLSGKDNYRKQPAVMLKWRAVSACARVVFPDVLMGMYTTEEIAPDTVRVDAEGEFEIVEAPSPKVTNIETARQTLGSGNPEVPRRLPVNGSTALQAEPAPEIKAPETVEPEPEPITEPTPEPTSGDDDIAKWEHYQALMAHESIKKLYRESVHRKNVLALLKKSGAFDSGKVSSMIWRVQTYKKLRDEGWKEEDAASAAATAPDELEGFGE